MWFCWHGTHTNHGSHWVVPNEPSCLSPAAFVVSSGPPGAFGTREATSLAQPKPALGFRVSGFGRGVFSPARHPVPGLDPEVGHRDEAHLGSPPPHLCKTNGHQHIINTQGRRRLFFSHLRSPQRQKTKAAERRTPNQALAESVRHPGVAAQRDLAHRRLGRLAANVTRTRGESIPFLGMAHHTLWAWVRETASSWEFPYVETS